MMLDRLIDNARKLGKETQHVAWAARTLGLDAVSLCVWCADHPDHRERLAYRLPRGGECEACPYVGRDALVIASAEPEVLR